MYFRETIDVGDAYIDNAMQNESGGVFICAENRDACAGQNRNQFTATGLMHAVVNLPNIEMIDQKILESGHTQMDVTACIQQSSLPRKKLSFTSQASGQQLSGWRGELIHTQLYLYNLRISTISKISKRQHLLTARLMQGQLAENQMATIFETGT
ncbi:unnamed protein product [Mytilus coruscus]|uniref:Uncharacterized protein n=1 Tax=Mytilus coruscus TaxID=42192 RepID=A0A6J8DMY3_MYTCO|nr:unnamed protein product [Mytilus coruscus]